MITRLEADAIAALFAAQTARDDELVAVLDDERALEGGWLYYVQTKRFVETGDEMYVLVGSGPFLVLAECGGIHHFGTGQPVEFYLSDLDSRAPIYLAREDAASSD
ncbi:MAG: YrhB domain-containing protein [Polyangiales bacterium]